MNPLKQIVRSDNWFSWKIPPLLAVAYASFLVNGTGFIAAIQSLGLILVCIASVASYGHIINDVFDIESDRQAGKPNVMAGMKSWQRACLCLASVVSGFGLLLLPGRDWLAIAVLLANYLLPTIYAAPPLRLKIRGFLGVLSDALGAHLIPTLFVLVIVGFVQDAASPIEVGIAVSALVWSLFLGLRGIIVHQILDASGDLRSNVITFAGRQSRGALRRLVLWCFFPLEVIALCVFVGLLIPCSWILASVTSVYILLECGKVRSGLAMPVFYEASESRERYVPLLNNSFYELWLPCSLILELCFMNPEYCIIGLIHLLFFGSLIVSRGLLLAGTVWQWIVRVRDRGISGL